MYNLLDDSIFNDRGLPSPLLSLESKYRIKLLKAFYLRTRAKISIDVKKSFLSSFQ